MPRTFRRAVLGRAVPLAAASMCATALLALPASALPASAATASAAQPVPGNTAASPAGTRLFVPPPSAGAPQQIGQLLKSHDGKDAALLAEMEAIPRAVWFTGGTPAQVQQQVAADDARGGRRARRAGPGRLRHPRPRLRPVLGRRGAEPGRLRGLDRRVRPGHRDRPGGRHPGAGRARQPALGLRAVRPRSTRSPTPSGSPSCSTRSRRWSRTPASACTWTARTARGSRSAR